MEKQFCTYEISLEFEELGFDEPCLGYYDKTSKQFYLADNGEFNLAKYCPSIICAAPLWQQIIDWFELKFSITIDITADECDDGESGEGPMFEYYIIDWRNLKRYYSEKPSQFIRRSNAREQAILKAIELCKKIQN